MTCFSIQKTLTLAALLVAAAVLAPQTARAQSGDAFNKTLEKAQEQNRDAAEKERQDARTAKISAPIVIELFTASDCTACVFADRMLYDTAKKPNVIALSCHIDDLGELVNNERNDGDRGTVSAGPMDPCIFRQWSYKTGRSKSDVTLNLPTFIINGYDEIDAEDLVSYEKMVGTYSYAYKNKALEVFMRWKDDDTITVHLPQDPKLERSKPNASVWIIRYKDISVERIDAGQNKGRVLRFSNIVQDIRHISKWHGATRSIDVDVAKPQGGKEHGGYVVVVQEMMGEPILAAGKLVDYPTPADRKAAAPRTQPVPAAQPKAPAAPKN